MASIGGDTNTLVRKFMDRRRKKGRVDTGFPKSNGKAPLFKPRKQGTGTGYKPGKRGY